MTCLLRVAVLLSCAHASIATPTRTTPPTSVTNVSWQEELIKTHFNAIPKSQPTAWAEQIPVSIFELHKRQAASTNVTSSGAAPATTNTAKLGRLVAGNTKISTLPAALCGFIPFDNGTGTGIEFVGCNGDGSVVTANAASFWFSNAATCTSTGNQFYCHQSSAADVASRNGCVDITLLNSYQYSTTSFPSQTYQESYSYNTISYSCTWNTVWSSSVCLMSYDIHTITTPKTVTAYSYHTDSLQLTSQLIYSFKTSVYITTSSFYTSGSYKLTTKTETSVSTGYTTAPVNSEAQKLSCPYSSIGKTLTVLDLAGLQGAYQGSTVTVHTTTSGASTQYSFIEAYATRSLPSASPGATGSPSAYLSQIKKSPPGCVDAMNTTCTALYTAAQACWSEAFPPGPADCYCSALLANSCSELCTSNRGDRRAYYNWIMGLCSTQQSTIGQVFARNWTENTKRTDAYYADLLPWDWTIEPAASAKPTAKCPSNANKIASFAVINIIVALSSLVLGRRTIVKKLTCGFFGHPGSPAWPFVAAFTVGTNILANAVNALMIARKAGWIAPPLGTLVLFWMARPRVAWMSTALGPVEKEKSMYVSLAASALLVETVLQSIGAVIIGRTVSFAAKNGFYLKNALQYAPHRKDALLMFSGALLWIVAIGFFYIYVIWNYLGVGTVANRLGNAIWRGIKKALGGFGRMLAKCWPQKWRKRRADKRNSQRLRDDDIALDSWNKGGKITATTKEVEVDDRENMHWEDALSRMGLNSQILSNIRRVFILMVLPFVGQWLFWVGFVGLYDDKYCPPSIWSMATVWVVFSNFGILLGASC
ncbi:hypothetical protein BT63DRAFT_412848 [Microthyrium microscopicum]|uniref:Extracellular membrane protein CFEM domain-containing protein n=1 Tax=Microthyrium microscopicum TaxID=703497 RepID=A0A6A6UF66_9PEZI|nr:hypothetical protein BT63DRAFT_412848 [Microthyrium microscopicum]